MVKPILDMIFFGWFETLVGRCECSLIGHIPPLNICITEGLFAPGPSNLAALCDCMQLFSCLFASHSHRLVIWYRDMEWVPVVPPLCNPTHLLWCRTINNMKGQWCNTRTWYCNRSYLFFKQLGRMSWLTDTHHLKNSQLQLVTLNYVLLLLQTRRAVLRI